MLLRVACASVLAFALFARLQIPPPTPTPSPPAPVAPAQPAATPGDTPTAPPAAPPGLLPLKLVAELETAIGDRPVTPPVLVGDKLLLSTESGELRAFELSTGALTWTLGLPGDRLLPVSIVANGLLVARADGLLFLLDPVLLEIRRGAFESPLSGSPVLGPDGSLLVATLPGRVSAFDKSLEHELWRHEAEAPVSAVAFGSGLVLLASPQGTLTALDPATGKPVWQFKGPYGFESAPVFDKSRDHVYAGDLGGNFYAISTRNGKSDYRWSTGGAVTVPALVDGDRVYVASYSNTLFCFSAGPGYELWRAELPARPAAAPQRAGSRVAVVALTGDVVEFDLMTGRRGSSTYQAPDDILPFPLIVPPRVVMSLLSGKTLLLETGSTTTTSAPAPEGAPAAAPSTVPNPDAAPATTTAPTTTVPSGTTTSSIRSLSTQK